MNSSDEGNHVVHVETGSYRDRANQIYYVDGDVLRGLNSASLDYWKELSRTRFFQDLMAQGKIVATELLNDTRAHWVKRRGWAGVLKHKTIPIVTYPYEWCFGMLKDAALLQLEILERGITCGWILKDATSYNVQAIGPRVTFIDVVSFEPYREGDPWVGYRQFCMMFLIPLMLKAYRNIDYIPFLRSDLEGIDPVEALKLFPIWSRFRRGVFPHVYLHSKMQTAFSNGAPGGDNTSTKKIKHTNAMVLGNIQSLKRLVKSLELRNEPTEWSNYAERHSYDVESFAQKRKFIEDHISKKHWGTVWDIGCNTGTFSQLCSRHADHVLSIDADTHAIEKLYQEQKRKKESNITPIIMNLSNASPAQGWRGRERKAFEERGSPDFLLCLALIHHMVISNNIPMRDFVEWLRTLNAHVVIEFVGPEDEMIRHMLKNRVNQYQDYRQSNFEAIVGETFEIADCKPLKGGKRMVYYLIPSGD